MRNLIPTALLIAGAGSLVGAASVEANQRTVDGVPVRVGTGLARTYLVLDGDRPVELGVALTPGAMQGLPAGHAPAPNAVTMPDGHVMYEHILTMPADNPTPFRHVVVNWNPAGHEPPGVYDTPHFDFHFYMISDEERRTVVPGPDFEAKGARLPSADEMPAGYLPTPPVPTMGVHWIDPKAPELNGDRFVQTFIAGSWDGRPTFLEPMITKAFLETKPNFSARIPPVARHAAPGWYPRARAIRWDAEAGEYRVALHDFARED